jgi:hypothetical protein
MSDGPDEKFHATLHSYVGHTIPFPTTATHLQSGHMPIDLSAPQYLKLKFAARQWHMADHTCSRLSEAWCTRVAHVRHTLNVLYLSVP